MLVKAIIPKFAIEQVLRRKGLHKNMQANFWDTSIPCNLKDCGDLIPGNPSDSLGTSARKSRRDFLGRPCPVGRANFAIVKFGIINLIDLYQNYIRVLLPCSCRFIPTCSEYTKEVFLVYGFRKGALRSLKRILRCHPFSRRFGYDPVL